MMATMRKRMDRRATGSPLRATYAFLCGILLGRGVLCWIGADRGSAVHAREHVRMGARRGRLRGKIGRRRESTQWIERWRHAWFRAVFEIVTY